MPNQAEDLTPPVIQLKGNMEDTVFISEQELAYRPLSTPYFDPGAVVEDIRAKFDCTRESLQAEITGTVNTNLPGNYLLAYNAKDASGNEAATVSRTVHVVNNRASFVNGIYNVVCTCTASIAGSPKSLVSSGKYSAVAAASSANNSFDVSALQLGSERVVAKAFLSGTHISLSYFSNTFQPTGSRSGTLSASKNSFTLETTSIQLSSVCGMSYRCKNVYTRRVKK